MCADNGRSAALRVGGLRAVAGVALVLVVAGCGASSGVGSASGTAGLEAPGDRGSATSSADPVDEAWRDEAASVLAAWEDFPVEEQTRPIVLIRTTAGPSGFRTGDQKNAFMSGNWAAPETLPKAPDTADGYPVISAREALDRLRTAGGNGGGEPKGTRISVVDMRLGSVMAVTDRGPLKLPAWRVVFTGSTGPNWVPAIAPPVRWDYDSRDLSGEQAATVQGRPELTFELGVPAGPPPCGGGEFRAEAVESAHAVAFRIIALERPQVRPEDNETVCPTGGFTEPRTVTVSLAEPLGNRVLLSVPAVGDVGGPVLVDVRAAQRDVSACQEVADDPEVAGNGAPAKLIRGVATTEGEWKRWLATRNGPDGPSQTPPPGGAHPASVVHVCVFESDTPRPISQPTGSTIETTGVEVLVRSGVVTLVAIGAATRLARQLDGLR